MESLSRPFHSRKLSNAASFSTQNPYDVVFSGNRRKYSGPSPIDVQDYREIFGSSQASSIPVLDLSTLGQPVDSLSFNFRDLKPDYSKIFGGFSDEAVAVSYEELFGRDKARIPSSTAPTSQDSDNLSHQSPDALKKFSMSYNKISPKSKDGLDGTKHVTQVPPVTGFTCFVDEPVMEAKKPNISAVNVKSSRNAARKESNHVALISEAKKSKTFDNDFKSQPSTVSSSPSKVVNNKDDPKRSINLESTRIPVRKENNLVESISKVSSSATVVVNNKDDPKRSINSESHKADFDVNSAASALKQAIEKAQESIRIAKESVGRKKNGLRSFSNKKIKNSSKVEEQKHSDESQVFQDEGRNRKYGGTVVLPDFKESEKLFVAKKFIDEIHEKISESVKGSKSVIDETEAKQPLDSATKDEHVTLCSEAVDTETSKIQTSDFVHEIQTDNKIVDEYEAEIEVSEATVSILEHQTVVKELESEENDNEVLQDFNQDGNQNSLDASMELPENEKKENVFEHEEVEYAESEKQENVIEHEEVEYAESEKHEDIEEVSVSVESVNDFKHEETSEVFDGFCEIDAKDSVQMRDVKLEESAVNLHDDCETKQEDDDTVERKGESLNESCDQEFDEKSFGDDNVLQETVGTDCVHVASSTIETNDVNEETTDDAAEVSCESQTEEADLGPASYNNEDEFEVKSEENDIIDNLADLGSENDQLTESSSDSSHGEKIIVEESNIVDNLTDHGSENDQLTESSSNSSHGEKITGEESNIIDNLTDRGSENDQLTESSSDDEKITDEESSNTQPPQKETSKTENTNEKKDSQEPESRKVSGKETFNRNDKQREWEKNRLAVDRVIREARERAFAEARERAERERAAVEKATEEVRQRMVAEAHEKVSKASVTNKSSENTSLQSKLRAERAAVERATAEARQRALEKAISQKTASDLNRSESALRTKAKLEKHNRIMERAAKALAEKEKRDRLAQKEQAERNRLAENLDADIKRWSNGKEGNLRALLSTLQYILGPESGWKPVTLTEIITTSAVKKAYRKATLCVHPDKLQQRGATIQQKYICEKVFDLLKAAWNRFNSEER